MGAKDSAASCPIQAGSLCMFDTQCNTTAGCKNWKCNIPGSEGRHFCGLPEPLAKDSATSCPIQAGSLCMFDTQCNTTAGCEDWKCNIPGSEGRHFCGPPKLVANAYTQAMATAGKKCSNGDGTHECSPSFSGCGQGMICTGSLDGGAAQNLRLRTSLSDQ